MASSDDPSRREGRYDRRELIRRAGTAGICCARWTDGWTNTTGKASVPLERSWL